MLAEIVAYLQACGLGTVGVDLFYGTLLPDQPDGVLAAFAYAGEPPEFDHGGALPALEHPGLQILTRDADEDAALARARAAYAALGAVRNRSLGPTLYAAITPLQAPFPLMPDASGRAVVVCNYRVSRSSR